MSGVRAVIKGAPRDGAIARITTAVRSAAVERPPEDPSREVLRSAYEAARRLQEAAQVEAARAVAEAEAKVRAELEAAWQERLRRLDLLLEELRAKVPELLAERLTPAVVTLALEVARKLVRREVEHDPALLVAWVRDAAERLHAATELVVRVNPEDLERLHASGVDLERAGMRLRWVADPAVEGGCVVECEAGVVDASLQTQLRTLRERLEEVCGG